MPSSFTAQGSGGSEFTFDRPTRGSMREEALVEKIVKGELLVLDDGPATRDVEVVTAWLRDEDVAVEQGVAIDPVVDDEVEVSSDGVPDGTVVDVLDWVDEPTDGWQDRARQAIAAEQARGEDARKGIVDRLTEALEG